MVFSIRTYLTIMACIIKLILYISVAQCWAEYDDINYYDYGSLRAYYNYILRQKEQAASGKGVTKTTAKQSQKTTKVALTTTPARGTTTTKKTTTKGQDKGQDKDKGTTTTKITSKTTKTTSVFRDLSKSYFQTLESYEAHATPTSEAQYPWIAKVVHSRSVDYPYVCTAVCIEPRIFITAGRCLVNLKLALTTVIYQKAHFPAKVFVLPSHPSKQMYDDVGIIVVESGNYKGNWPKVELFSAKRTDEQYQWFADLNLAKEPLQHKVIGYVTKKYLHRKKTPSMEFNLSELNVIVDINTCSTILSKGVAQAFFVPCYHSCNATEFKKRSVDCQKYLGAEGAAVLNVKTNKLLGVATWGTPSHLYELPVGFAIPNSANFYKDIACARKIRNDNAESYKGYYQNLCYE